MFFCCEAVFLQSSVTDRSPIAKPSNMEGRKLQRVSPMAASVPGPLNDQEIAQAAGLLMRAVVHGQQSIVAKQVNAASHGKPFAVHALSFLDDFVTGDCGSMSDATKRHREEEGDGSEWRLVQASAPVSSYSGPPVMTETPMPSSAGITEVSTEDTAVPMPCDIKSLQEWSKTELTLPKVAHLKVTYGEFVDQARDDPELLKYAKLLMASFGFYAENKRTDKYTPAVDFANYLCRIKFQTGTEQTFKRTTRK